MPDRPPPPGFITTLNDIERRLRDTERQVLLPAQDDDAVQVLEDGNVLGPVDYLDFGANLHAVLIGDRYVRIDAPASALQFDAVVDGNAGVTDEAARVFLGIGEALAYLHSLGMQSVNVLVRNKGDHSSSGNETYTETANWNSPASVMLFGARGGPGTSQFETGISWDIGTFAPNSAGPAFNPPKYAIYNFAHFDMSGILSVPKFESLYLANTHFNPNGLGSTAFLCSGVFVAENCTFDIIGTTKFAATICDMDQCEVGFRSISGAGGTFTPAGQAFYFTGHISVNSSSGVHRLALPTSFDIIGREMSFNRTGLSTPNNDLTFDVPADAKGRIWQDEGVFTPGGWVISAPSELDFLDIRGAFSDITLTAGSQYLIMDVVCSDLTVGNSTGGPPPLIRAAVQGDLVVGHAQLDATIEGANRTVTINGPATGFINGRAVTRSSGTFITFNGDWAHLTVAYNEALATGTASPYAFAAAANDHLLLMMGTTDWPVAGTDAGSRNLVFPEDFGGGSPPVAGHVIEDEGTPLTQRANINFTGAGVTATDSAPDTVVTIPGVGTPTAGWGSVTNVTTDRVYDANASTLDELLDVVGTLIADLVAQGVLAN